MANTESEKRSFEQMLARLEEIVRALEKGEVSLEQSMTLYTEGAELIRVCTGRLNEAEQIVMRVQKSPDGSPVLQPFTEEEE